MDIIQVIRFFKFRSVLHASISTQQIKLILSRYFLIFTQGFIAILSCQHTTLRCKIQFLFWYEFVNILLNYLLLNQLAICAYIANSFQIVQEFVGKFMHIFHYSQLMLQFEEPHSNRLTPDVSPKMNLNGSQLVMTPLILGQDMLENQQLEGFSLEGYETNEKYRKSHHKIIKKQHSFRSYRPRINSMWQIVEDDLEEILEEENYQMLDEEISDYDANQSEMQFEHIEQSENPHIQLSFNVSQKKTVTNISQSVYPQSLITEWQVPNPKKQLLLKLKSITEKSKQSDEEKLLQYKQILLKYAFQFEKYYIEDSISKLSVIFSGEQVKEDIEKPKTNKSFKIIQDLIFQGINETFKKNIGGLPFQKRRVKLLKYLRKKKNRVWQKKVNYDCRKKVADCRLRIKGKFVTVKQAYGMGITQSQIEKKEKNLKAIDTTNIKAQ